MKSTALFQIKCRKTPLDLLTVANQGAEVSIMALGVLHLEGQMLMTSNLLITHSNYRRWLVFYMDKTDSLFKNPTPFYFLKGTKTFGYLYLWYVLFPLGKLDFQMYSWHFKLRTPILLVKGFMRNQTDENHCELNFRSLELLGSSKIWFNPRVYCLMPINCFTLCKTHGSFSLFLNFRLWVSSSCIYSWTFRST